MNHKRNLLSQLLMYEPKQSPLPCTVKCPLPALVIAKLPCLDLQFSVLRCVLCVLLMQVFMSVHHYMRARGYRGVASVTVRA